MQLGDVLEWLAIVLLAVSAYLWQGMTLALAVLAVGCFYLAQVFSGTPIWRQRAKPDQ